MSITSAGSTGGKEEILRS